MAATLADDTTRAWELDGGREVLYLEHTSKVLELQFRPDGAMLATVGEDWRARLVDVDEASEPCVLEHRALGLAFSPDSRILATGTDAIVLWGPDPS
jgi:WD40 repeat protein